MLAYAWCAGNRGGGSTIGQAPHATLANNRGRSHARKKKVGGKKRAETNTPDTHTHTHTHTPASTLWTSILKNKTKQKKGSRTGLTDADTAVHSSAPQCIACIHGIREDTWHTPHACNVSSAIPTHQALAHPQHSLALTLAPAHDEPTVHTALEVSKEASRTRQHASTPTRHAQRDCTLSPTRIERSSVQTRRFRRFTSFAASL